MAKRKYTRRTEAERIAELEDKIRAIRKRMESKTRKDAPVLKEIPKLKRAVQRFSQVAIDHDRQDLSNTCLAFLAGLERAAKDVPEHMRQTQEQD